MASFVNEEFVKSLKAQGGRTIKSFTGGNRDLKTLQYMSSLLQVLVPSGSSLVWMLVTV